MKILMVHNCYRIPGGEDTVVENEKKLLEDNGHEVVLYTRHNNEINKMNLLQKLCLPIAFFFNIRTYNDVRKIIREESIDIVHVHNTLHLVSQAVYYAAVSCGVPVVQTVHNFRFLCPGATFYCDGHICEDCVTKGLYCAVRHKCYRNSFAETLLCTINTWLHRQTGILKKINYICLTEFNKEKLLQLKHIKAEKVFIKPNFTFAPPPYGGARNYYLFVGRIEEIKGVRLLIEAFRHLPDKELLLAGDGPLFAEMEQLSPQNVSFIGRVSHDRLLELISSAKAVILPSQVYEGFPMVIPEAFSLYTPMLVGDLGNCGSLIIDGVNGMKFKYNDASNLIQALRRFEHSDVEAIVQAAYQDFQMKYSPASNYKTLFKIYSKIIGVK